jgi:phosphoglucosamine mutase
MVSASHNPAEDNGIKVFTHEGEKLSDELEIEVEAAMIAESATPAAPRPPHVEANLELAYLEHLLVEGGRGLHLAGTTLVLDCANGGGSRIAPRVFGRLGANVHALAAEPDGENINRDCGSTHPENLQNEVRRRGAKLGIALDGDGDRCILVDERGELVHGDGILTILGRHAADRREWHDRRIVATVMSNRGLHRALREVGVEVVEVGVGDRAVVEAMRSRDLELGGEQSGHIVLGRRNAYIGDGTFTALAVLRVMQETERRLSELASPYQPFPQVLLNVPVSRKPSLAGMPAVVAAIRTVEEALGRDGRVLLRYSGTEPLVRVMVEGPDAREIGAAAHGLADLLAREIGA